MTEIDKQLSDLKQIRHLMERSSRFISLSGLSGIAAGMIALVGAAIARWRIIDVLVYKRVNSYRAIADFYSLHKLMYELIALAAITLLLALTAAYFFTSKKASEEGQSLFDKASKRLLINLAIPLLTGGLFCLFLLQENISLVAPAMLIFYGLALVNGSKYTLDHIRYLGIAEVVLGLVACLFPGKGLLFWAIGFGVFHIIYGAVMYFKLER
ncbi:MAG: hypothetical protein H7259_09270 [Cytophagales bacterium]|nr:hypothetical protein [Cytophaga sp.]